MKNKINNNKAQQNEPGLGSEDKSYLLKRVQEDIHKKRINLIL